LKKGAISHPFLAPRLLVEVHRFFGFSLIGGNLPLF
jgi:hypothetical protein